MARWFSELFGRSDSDPGNAHRASHTAPDERTATGPEVNDRTVRIDRSKSAKLSWPARDGQDSLKQPARTESVSLPYDPRETGPHDPPDPHEAPTRLVESRPERSPATSSSPSQPMSRRPSEAPSRAPVVPMPIQPHDDMTRLIAPAQLTEHDPVVGWLVVIAGPGRGRSLEIGAGTNSIGRAAGQKLCLNFGDLQVSREKHALLTYDPRSRRFFLNNGEVRNLTYIENEVVLAPVELKGGETVTVGNTQLRFVRFCDSDFSWP